MGRDQVPRGGASPLSSHPLSWPPFLSLSIPQHRCYQAGVCLVFSLRKGEVAISPAMSRHFLGDLSELEPAQGWADKSRRFVPRASGSWIPLLTDSVFASFRFLSSVWGDLKQLPWNSQAFWRATPCPLTWHLTDSSFQGMGAQAQINQAVSPSAASCSTPWAQPLGSLRCFLIC